MINIRMGRLLLKQRHAGGEFTLVVDLTGAVALGDKLVCAITVSEAELIARLMTGPHVFGDIDVLIGGDVEEVLVRVEDHP